jgi:hypothetical protein
VLKQIVRATAVLAVVATLAAPVAVAASEPAPGPSRPAAEVTQFEVDCLGVSLYVPEGGAEGRGDPARAGLSGATAPKVPLLTGCMASAAHMAVTEGGFTLRDRETR